MKREHGLTSHAVTLYASEHDQHHVLYSAQSLFQSGARMLQVHSALHLLVGLMGSLQKAREFDAFKDDRCGESMEIADPGQLKLSPSGSKLSSTGILELRRRA